MIVFVYIISKIKLNVLQILWSNILGNNNYLMELNFRSKQNRHPQS